MKLVTTTLTAGCFVSTGTRVMQIAGRLTDEGFDARYYLQLSHTREITDTENYTKDTKRSKEYTFEDGPGIPVVMSIHQDIRHSGAETILIVNAETEEIISANCDGYVPPLINERDASATRRMNKFFGRTVFVATTKATKKEASAQLTNRELNNAIESLCSGKHPFAHTSRTNSKHTQKVYA